MSSSSGKTQEFTQLFQTHIMKYITYRLTTITLEHPSKLFVL
jgi:hypothetical protein